MDSGDVHVISLSCYTFECFYRFHIPHLSLFHLQLTASFFSDLFNSSKSKCFFSIFKNVFNTLHLLSSYSSPTRATLMNMHCLFFSLFNCCSLECASVSVSRVGLDTSESFHHFHIYFLFLSPTATTVMIIACLLFDIFSCGIRFCSCVKGGLQYFPHIGFLQQPPLPTLLIHYLLYLRVGAWVVLLCQRHLLFSIFQNLSIVSIFDSYALLSHCSYTRGFL